MTKSELIPILLLAISSNGDNVAVGIAYGIGRINVPLASNLLIAMVTGAGTLLSMWLGHAVGSMMAPKVAAGIGGAIIAAIGGLVVVQSMLTTTQHDGNGTPRSSPTSELRTFTSLISVLRDPLGADADSSRRIEVKESWLLAIALSLNNTVNGTAAGMLGMNPVWLTIFVMLFSVLTLSAGLAAGYQVQKRWLGSLSGALSGLLLVAVGLYEIRA